MTSTGSAQHSDKEGKGSVTHKRLHINVFLAKAGCKEIVSIQNDFDRQKNRAGNSRSTYWKATFPSKRDATKQCTSCEPLTPPLSVPDKHAHDWREKPTLQFLNQWKNPTCHSNASQDNTCTSLTNVCGKLLRWMHCELWYLQDDFAVGLHRSSGDGAQPVVSHVVQLG